MKGLSKKIFTSILALILTGAALGTGVFAWFTINNTATANGFEGTVEAASGGFMVSLDGKKWSTSVDLKEVSVIGGKFSDLTTVDGTNFYKFGDDSQPVTTGYVSFDLYFAAGDFKNIEATVTIHESEKTTWVSDIPGSVGDTKEGYASSAVRVAFIQDGTLTKAFERAADTNNTVGVGTLTTNQAVLDYNAVNSNVITSTNFAKVGSADVLAKGTLNTAAADVAELGELLSGMTEAGEGYTKYAKVTVNVWIEGWDQEAYNAILNGKVNIDFSFKAK